MGNSISCLDPARENPPFTWPKDHPGRAEAIAEYKMRRSSGKFGANERTVEVKKEEESLVTPVKETQKVEPADTAEVDKKTEDEMKDVLASREAGEDDVLLKKDTEELEDDSSSEILVPEKTGTLQEPPSSETVETIEEAAEVPQSADAEGSMTVVPTSDFSKDHAKVDNADIPEPVGSKELESDADEKVDDIPVDSAVDTTAEDIEKSENIDVAEEFETEESKIEEPKEPNVEDVEESKIEKAEESDVEEAKAEEVEEAEEPKDEHVDLQINKDTPSLESEGIAAAEVSIIAREEKTERRSSIVELRRAMFETAEDDLPEVSELKYDVQDPVTGEYVTLAEYRRRQKSRAQGLVKEQVDKYEQLDELALKEREIRRLQDASRQKKVRSWTQPTNSQPSSPIEPRPSAELVLGSPSARGKAASLPASPTEAASILSTSATSTDRFKESKVVSNVESFPLVGQ